MAEEIVIGKLIIDNTDLDRAMLESKSRVVELEASQKELKKSTDGLTNATEEQLKTFVSNETALKKARSEYSANQKTVLQLVAAQTGLDNELKKNIKTQDEAIANTKALTEARRKIDTTTAEGAKAIAEINTKIDANNKLLDGSNSTLEKQKTNIGNYPNLMNAVGSSFSSTTTQIIGFAQKGKDVIGELSGTISAYKTAQEVSAVASEAYAAAQAVETIAIEAATAANERAVIVGFRRSQGLATDTEVEIANTAATTANANAQAAQAATTSAAATATTAAATASKALRIAMLAIPLVALLALLSPIITYFTSTQEGIDKVTAVTRPLVAIFDSLMGVLQGLGKVLVDTFSNPKKAISDLADLVKNNLMNRFKAFGVVLEGIMNLDFKKVADGVLQGVSGVENLTDKISNAAGATDKFLDDAIKKGQELDKLEKKLRATKNENLLLIGEQTEEVKKQNEIAEDQTKTNKEREIATQKSIVAAREINRLKNVELDIEIEILKNKQSRNDTSDSEKAELNKLIAAKNQNNATLLELETTQTNKLNSIRKSANDKATADADKAFQESLKQAQNRIDIMKAEASQANLTADERMASAKKVYELENELAKKSSKGSDLEKQLLQNRQNLSSELLSIAKSQIDQELEEQKKAFELTKEITTAEKDARVTSAQDLALAQTLLLDKKLLTEKQYADAIVEIEKGKVDSISIINKNYEEAEKIRKQTQIENEKALSEVSFQLKLQDILDKDAAEQEIKQALLIANYENEQALLVEALSKKEISEEVYRKKKLLAEKKFNADTKANDKILAEQKQANNLTMLKQGIAALSALFGESKAVAVAGALVNTYEGIAAGVKLGYPLAIPAVAMAAATGFAAVKNIMKTNKTSTSGSTTTATPVTTGASSFVNVAQTSTVATVSEKPVEQNTVVTPPVLVLETLQEVTTQQQIKIKSD